MSYIAERIDDTAGSCNLATPTATSSLLDWTPSRTGSRTHERTRSSRTYSTTSTAVQVRSARYGASIPRAGTRTCTSLKCYRNDVDIQQAPPMRRSKFLCRSSTDRPIHFLSYATRLITQVSRITYVSRLNGCETPPHHHHRRSIYKCWRTICGTMLVMNFPRIDTSNDSMCLALWFSSVYGVLFAPIYVVSLNVRTRGGFTSVRGAGRLEEGF